MTSTGVAIYTGSVFPGLRPFRPDERILFFGREEQTDELLRRLGETRFLAVIGLSGTGKSSLVQAGLVPALERGHLAESGSRWRVAIMKPGLDPLNGLVAKLNETLGESEDRLAMLRSARLGLADASRYGREPDENLLLVVDQFEELFRFQRDRAGLAHEATEFVGLLLAAAQEYTQDYRIYVVLTMRSDYLGECARFPGLVQTLNEGQYLTEPMAREHLRGAIQGPAALGGVSIDAGLIEALLDKAAGQPDQLPVLQHLLMRMWAVRTGPRLTFAEYDHPLLGGWEHALDLHANAVLAGLSKADQELAKRIFQRLTEKGEENRENRRPTQLLELSQVANKNEAAATEAASEVAVTEVAKRFQREDCSFLTAPDKKLGTQSILDISHESLIRRWNLLREWAREEAAWGDWYQRVEDRVRTGGQLSGSELNAALKAKLDGAWNAAWAERYRTDKNGVKPTYDQVIGFLSDSERERLEKERAEETQREKVLRDLRKTRLLTALVAVFFAGFASVALYFWWTQKQEASRNALGFSSSEQASGHTLEALHWAAESLTVYPNPLAAARKAALLEIGANLSVTSLSVVASHDGPVRGARFSKDESRILTWSEDGTARQWEAGTGRQIGPALQHQGRVDGALFTKDESRILTWSEDGTARQWEAGTGRQIGPALQHQGRVDGALFTKDESRILTWSEDGTARLWDARTGRQIGLALQHRRRVNGALFSKDGSRILTWSYDHTAQLWDAGTGGTIGHALDHGGPVDGASFNKDESLILTWGGHKVRRWDVGTRAQIGPELDDPDVEGAVFNKDESRILTWSGGFLNEGGAQLWDARTGSKVVGGTLTHDGDVNGALFSKKDGSRILTWSDDHTARLWDAKTGRPIGPALRHDGAVIGAAFSEDESLILTWSRDKTARLWDVKTCSQIGPAVRHGDSVNGATFSGNESRILTWSSDNRVRLWDFRRASWTGAALRHEGGSREQRLVKTTPGF